MNLRRVLLLMAMILLVTAAVVAIVPPRRSQPSNQVVLPPPPAPGAQLRNITLRFPPRGSPAVTRLVQGDHALITVSTAQPGDAVTMGLTDTGEPGTPATFDVLAPGPGHYPVTFTPDFGSPQRIATIDVGP